MMPPRHFLDIDLLSRDQLRHILGHAHALKGNRRDDRLNPRGPCAGASLAMIFEQPSTRTRVSFELAMQELGGHTIVLSRGDMQLGRGESVADTARVLSRYVDAIMLRTASHATLLELAQNAEIPVINGLTCSSHPCQVMADIMTFEEHLGRIEGRTIAWIGDANNVANSWIHAAARLGFKLNIASPQAFAPDPALIERMRKEGARIEVTDDPLHAATGADCVLTDVFVSMSDADAAERNEALMPYQVNGAVMARAKRDAIFMHCLPAHRGEEVTAEVIDGRQSVVWDEAENRLHAQKAILCWCLDEESAGAAS